MCNFYGIPYATYIMRRKYGWSKKEALTTTSDKREKPVVDHNRRKFNSIKEMCSFYGVSPAVYGKRREAGWPKKLALTAPNACKKPVNGA